MSDINSTPVSSRIQIGFFGCTNSGKSSLINAVTGQNVAIVSEKEGTTTDPVIKTMELGALGPVALVDTPGIDDATDIGDLRIKRAYEMFDRVDMAVLVADSTDLAGAAMSDPRLSGKVQEKFSIKKKQAKDTFTGNDNKKEVMRIAQLKALIDLCVEKKKPYIVVINKADIFGDFMYGKIPAPAFNTIALAVSATEGTGVEELKKELTELGKNVKTSQSNALVSDLIKEGDTVILVIPIDASAPKGRLILPQQQVIRDILDAGGNALCVKDTELEAFFKANVTGKGGLKPALVITDSQVFPFVADVVPDDIALTSFSILMARYKGELRTQVDGARTIDSLEDGDMVLIAEGCTHHKTCEDIGTVKLPVMLKKYTGKDVVIESTSGHGFPDDLKKYRLILHCGGCMLGNSEMQSRIEKAVEAGVPITNYGVAIAYMNGILERSVAPLPEILFDNP